jgi:hypothetical protein
VNILHSKNEIRDTASLYDFVWYQGSDQLVAQWNLRLQLPENIRAGDESGLIIA